MTGRLFNGEHNLRVRSRKTILELEPGLDAGRADTGAAGQESEVRRTIRSPRRPARGASTALCIACTYGHRNL